MNTTTIKFHQEMRSIVETMGNFYSAYEENLSSVEAIFERYSPYMDEDYPSSNQEENRKKYFKAISSINYDIAKKVSGIEDLLVTVENKEYKVPFYIFEITENEFKEVKVNDNKLCFITEEHEDAEELENDVLKQVSFCFEYRCSFNKEGIVNFYIEYKVYSEKEDLKKFYISYEHFSSHAFDAGGTKEVYAKSAEMAEGLVAHMVYPPEDGLSWDMTVYDGDYNVISEDNSSCSYLNAIERPGIAKAKECHA